MIFQLKKLNYFILLSTYKMPRIFLNSEITFLINSVQHVIQLLFQIFTLLIKILIRHQTSDSNDSCVESEEEEEDDCEPHCRCRACEEVERKRILLRHHRKKALSSLVETGDKLTSTSKEREEESDA